MTHATDRTTTQADIVELEIQWQRLLALLGESALTVIRTAFSKVVSEGGDFGCLLYDRHGRMIAQDTGVSSKLAASPRTVEKAIERYPEQSLRPGDVLISNDPWLVCGHLYDVSIIRPLYHQGRLVGYGECFGHMPDVGGSLSNDSHQVYEEGLFLPVVKLLAEGQDVREIWDILRGNVRVPNQLEGDLRAFISALAAIEGRVSSFLDQYGMPDLQQLADQIISRSERATRENIRRNIPPGLYTNRFELDGFDASEKLAIEVAVKVESDSITLDFTGTSPQSAKAVNCTEVYAYAWSLYAVRCFVSPNIPINKGLFIPIRIHAPEGTIVNARHPAPVRMKSSTGTFLPFAIFGAMAKVIPERVLAESGNKCIMRCFATDKNGRHLAETPHFMGGMGARYSKDGIACMGFPGAGGETPVEMLENSLPITFLHKRLLPDSGGPGRFRGGTGQELAIRSESDAPVRMMLQNMKVQTPAAGYVGGMPGALGRNLLNGNELPGKAAVTMKKGDVVEIRIAGGGGMFPPAQRTRERLIADIAQRAVTAEGALRDYGTKVDAPSAADEGKRTAMLKLGVDIGGTFTDLVLLDTESGRLHLEKVLTTPSDPAVGFIAGVRSILENAGVPASSLRHVIHGTTLVVNAIIERKGCKTGFLTTAGFEDTLEMRRGRRFDMDDLLIETPPTLVPRALVRGVQERMNKDGEAIVPFDDASAARAIAELADEGVQSIAISFLHAYRNAAHEQRAAALVAKIAPQVTVSISSEVVPDVREYERALTTVANAYTQPIVEKYVANVKQELKALGYAHELYLIQSDAGLTTGTSAARFPVRLLESGPAGGSVAARYFSEQLKKPDLAAFDMGGTTAKVSFISNSEIVRAPELEVARHHRFKRGSGLPIRVPVVQMMEIGAGGGGIARIDDVGLLKVGPESSGADPGPACYDRGGRDATVTDANLLLGYLNPEFFLGGQMRLSIAAAREAVGAIAARLNLDTLRTAWGIHDIVTEDMAQAARMHLMERGADPRAYAMLAFGGAGPLHACRLARKIGMREVIIPHSAGVASAFGFLVAPISITLLQAYPAELAQVDFDHLRNLFAELERRGREFLAGAGVPAHEMSLKRYASLHYAGQSSELTVAVPQGAPDAGQMQQLEHAFREMFSRVYGRANESIEVEALNWIVIASGPKPQIHEAEKDAGSARPSAARPARRAYFPELGDYVECPVYLRNGLKAGDEVHGPALIEERESTTVILPDSTAEVDRGYNLRIRI